MPNFEEKLASLEAVVERLERGDLGLNESVSLFEQGIQLSSACKEELASAEGRVQILLEQTREPSPDSDFSLEEGASPFFSQDEDEDEETEAG